MVRALFPRRKHHVILTRTSAAFELAFRQGLIDAAVVDVSAGSANGSGGNGGEETWRVARMAAEFPSVPFFGLLSLRASDTTALTQCASCEFLDVLVEGVDDAVAREIVSRASFSARFARALHDDVSFELSISTSCLDESTNRRTLNAPFVVGTAIATRHGRCTARRPKETSS